MTTLDKLKMIFGFALLLILGTLAFTTAIGKIEASTSFGLMPVITTLSTLAGAFAGWAFKQKKEE